VGGGGGGDDDSGGGGDDDSGGGGDKDDNEVDEEDKQADRTIEADNVQGLDNTITQDSPSFDSTIAIGPGDRPNLDTNTALRSFMAPPVDPVDPLTPPVDPVDPLTPPVDPVDPLTPPVDPVDPLTPPVDPVDPLTPPVDPDNPQLNDDSESISDIKKEVIKTEEILSLEDEKFVDSIINYATEQVEKDIDDESKLLLTKLTPDETKAFSECSDSIYWI
jgi:hypothetical protein